MEGLRGAPLGSSAQSRPTVFRSAIQYRSAGDLVRAAAALFGGERTMLIATERTLRRPSAPDWLAMYVTDPATRVV